MIGCGGTYSVTTTTQAVDTFSEGEGGQDEDSFLQSLVINESVNDLSVRLVRANSSDIDHHKGKIPRGRDPGIRGGNCDVWRLHGGRLLYRNGLTW